jgi:Tfp pilus assembly protein PilX
MKKIGIILGVVVVIGVLVLILVAVAGGSYNRLVKFRRRWTANGRRCKMYINAAQI